MLEFMKLYDKTDNNKHGKFKLSHFDIGKLLKCAIDTDKYGNIYYRNCLLYTSPSPRDS